MKFEKENPFWLHPIEENQLDTLFIDREDKINLIERIFSSFPRIICTIIGGVGTGKSSILRYTKKIAKENDYSVGLVKDVSDVPEVTEEIIKEKEVALIDNIDKLEDTKANKFYNSLETLLDQSKFVFFTDTLERDEETKRNREFTISQSLTLSYRMSTDNLEEFLSQRMENCLSEDFTDFELPFSKRSLNMAAIRSRGNLRRFLKYTQTAWLSKKDDKDQVSEDEMKTAIAQKDKDILYGLSKTDYQILWYSTKGEISKKFLKQKTGGIHTTTLNKKLNGPLKNFVTVKKSGRNSLVKTIYVEIPHGKEILRDLLKDLQVDIPELY